MRQNCHWMVTSGRKLGWITWGKLDGLESVAILMGFIMGYIMGILWVYIYTYGVYWVITHLSTKLLPRMILQGSDQLGYNL